MTESATVARISPAIRWPGVLVWMAAVGLSIAAARLQPGRFMQAYLFAWLLWLGAGLGALAIVMLHHMTGGNWGLSIRRIGEAASLTLPLLMVLFVPILLGLKYLYPWARPEEVAADPVLRHKAAYLNVTFFTIRYLIFFIAWSGLAIVLSRWSLKFDRTRDPYLSNRIHKFSAAGILFYAVSMSLASVDWLMSRQPHWYSTVFGFIMLIGQVTTALCVILIALWFLRNQPPLARALSPERYIDLGNLLLTLVILWSYLALSQFLVSWMGNSQEEIPWYVQRTGGGWRWAAVSLMGLHFFVPFVLLLMRDIKKRAGLLTWVAVLVLMMRVVDVFWTASPSGEQTRQPFAVSWIDAAVFVGIGGLWLGTFLRLLRGRPLIAAAEPDVEMLPEHGKEHG